MPKFDYSRPRETARRLIARFGKDAKLIKRVASGPEWDRSFEEFPHDIKLVEINQEIRNASGDLTFQRKKMVYISTEGLAAGIQPSKEDLIEVNGERIGIERPMALQPGDMILLWEVELAG